MRSVVQALIEGQWDSHYLIADAGDIEGLKDLGVHSKKVLLVVLLDVYKQGGLDFMLGRGFVQRGAADTWSKMRPDMMIVEMTKAEQQQYLRHDTSLDPD